MREFSTILVTGGAGFIGSNFIRFLFGESGYSGRVVNLDALTYAGNLENLEGVAEAACGRYSFARGDICDAEFVRRVFEEYSPDAVVHFAAESHVDRSILGPEAFVRTNVLGTHVLLEAARNSWKGREGTLFHHISTDEVYGSLGESGAFSETTRYDPRSPYSASKAASDHLVSAYFHTYGLPATTTNCSNNYGPYQFPEKLIPLVVMNILEGRPLPIYGDGSNVRDWLYVTDHAAAVWTVMRRGTAGETYNIGGGNEWDNLRLVRELCRTVARLSGGDAEAFESRITFVKDRPGHDKRYAIDSAKLRSAFGWEPAVTFQRGLEKTVSWYLDNPGWISRVKSGEYRSWIDRNYSGR